MFLKSAFYKHAAPLVLRRPEKPPIQWNWGRAVLVPQVRCSARGRAELRPGAGALPIIEPPVQQKTPDFLVSGVCKICFISTQVF